MTHDRKPAKVRVLEGPADAAGRRRGDVPPTIVEATARHAARARRSRLLTAMLFVVGSAIGGAATAWLGIGGS